MQLHEDSQQSLSPISSVDSDTSLEIDEQELLTSDSSETHASLDSQSSESTVSSSMDSESEFMSDSHASDSESEEGSSGHDADVEDSDDDDVDFGLGGDTRRGATR